MHVYERGRHIGMLPADLERQLTELDNALEVLVQVHTRNHECSFAIMTGGPAPTDELMNSQAYVNAWRTVRRYLGQSG